jgi:hypothetical protein
MTLSQYALPVLYTLFIWWFSTGVILYLNGLPRWTFKWTMGGATALLLLALLGLYVTGKDTRVTGAYLAFSCALLVWAWLEAHRLCIAGRAASRTRAGGAWRSGGGRHLERTQPDRLVDLRGAVGHAPERQAQCLPGRAQPQRVVFAGAPQVHADLLHAQGHEPAVSAIGHIWYHRRVDVVDPSNGRWHWGACSHRIDICCDAFVPRCS